MPGSNCRVRQRYLTVLSRPTLRPVLQAEGCIEAHLRVQDAICGLCVLWWHTEALVEAGEEVSEHAVSVIDGCCLRESQFGYEPVLEGAGHTLHPPLACGERISAVRQARPSRD